jgi:biotin synthase-related radical SAM superfamily protein
MEPVTSEEVTEVTINVDKEDTIISKPTGTTTSYTGKVKFLNSILYALKYCHIKKRLFTMFNH